MRRGSTTRATRPERWCRERDSNPHARGRRFLRPLCLLFHHRGGRMVEASTDRWAAVPFDARAQGSPPRAGLEGKRASVALAFPTRRGPKGRWVSVLALATSALFLKERAGPTGAARRRCRRSACGRVPDDHPRPPSGASTFGARPIPKVPTHRQPRHPVANRRRPPTSTLYARSCAESSTSSPTPPPQHPLFLFALSLGSVSLSSYSFWYGLSRS